MRRMEDVVEEREGVVAKNGYNRVYSIIPARRMIGSFGLGFDD